jgi:hypothetical protein
MPDGRPDVDRSFVLSLEPSARPAVAVATSAPASATTCGVLVAHGGGVPPALGIGRAWLEAAAGLDGGVGSALVVPSTDGPVLVAFGRVRIMPDRTGPSI